MCVWKQNKTTDHGLIVFSSLKAFSRFYLLSVIYGKTSFCGPGVSLIYIHILPASHPHPTIPYE